MITNKEMYFGGVLDPVLDDLCMLIKNFEIGISVKCNNRKGVQYNSLQVLTGPVNHVHGYIDCIYKDINTAFLENGSVKAEKLLRNLWKQCIKKSARLSKHDVFRVIKHLCW